MNNYHCLSPEERALIMIERDQGSSICSISSISSLLNHSLSTVYRG
ncbi:hypothetical protein [uncultured Gammaproteobacteria bacterium]|nr:hypothetical protein [uncultured Gammaproteobacteria bacterium]